jgi:hypothetical protein
MRVSKPVGLSIAFCFVTTVAAATMTTSVEAHTRCRPVFGTIHSLFTSTDCTSPIGLCTAGKISGGELDGATTYEAFNAAPSAGLPATEPAADLVYDGDLTINARRGTLVTHDLGVIDSVGLSFTEIERPASGTGDFANPSNNFFIFGAITDAGEGFTGVVTGILCSD